MRVRSSVRYVGLGITGFLTGLGVGGLHIEHKDIKPKDTYEPLTLGIVGAVFGLIVARRVNRRAA